jgi:putative transposase
MVHMPGKHRRRSIRLPRHDYTRPGAYFVTICTQDLACIFGRVVDAKMRLSTLGRFAETYWNQIPDHFPRVKLDEYVVMPNHMHGILWIIDTVDFGVGHVGAQHAAPLRENPVTRPHVIPGSLGAIVRSFKSVVTRSIRSLDTISGIRVWQRNYHDNIIRTQQSLERIRRYIRNNPANWDRDKNNPARSRTSRDTEA